MSWVFSARPCSRGTRARSAAAMYAVQAKVLHPLKGFPGGRDLGLVGGAVPVPSREMVVLGRLMP